jgi:hypothetical protein
MQEILNGLKDFGASVGGWAGFVQSVAVWSAALLVLGRVIPEKRIEQMFCGFGVAVSTAGSLKFGKVWEKLETFIESRLGAAYRGFTSGLDKDNGAVPPA